MQQQDKKFVRPVLSFGRWQFIFQLPGNLFEKVVTTGDSISIEMSQV